MSKETENTGVARMPKVGSALPPYCYACRKRRPAHDKAECRATILRTLDAALSDAASCYRALAKLDGLQ